MALELELWYTVPLGLTIVAIVCFLRFVRRNDDYWLKRGLIYEPRLSFISLAIAIYRKPLHELINGSYQKYGRLYGRFENSTPQISVAEPELLRDILVKDFHAFSDRRDMGFGDKVIGKMLFFVNGDDWKRIRSLLTPAFTSRKMRKMTGIINACTETVLGALKKQADEGGRFDCRKIYGAFTMDVIASSAFATKIDSHNDPDNPFVKHAKQAFSGKAILLLIISSIIPKSLAKIIGFQPLDGGTIQFFRSITMQVIEERRRKNQKGNDFLQMLMDASEEVLEGEEKVAGFKTVDDEEDDQGRVDNSTNIVYTTKKLSQDEILAQCILFFMVGYETTASSLSFLSYALSENLECQEQLIKEVDQAFEKHTSMSYDVVRDMKYLDSVISETLRMYPAAAMSERIATEDYKLGNTGITIKKGMSVSIPIYPMHYDKQLFADPQKFDPTRFMGSNGPTHHPYAYIPFGAGPRNCIGMRFALLEIKLCICNILRQYRFHPPPGPKVPLQFVFAQGLLSAKEVMVTIEKRNDVNAL